MTSCASIVVGDAKNETDFQKLRGQTRRWRHPFVAYLLHGHSVRRIRGGRIGAATGTAFHQSLYQKPGNPSGGALMSARSGRIFTHRTGQEGLRREPAA